MCYAIIGAEGDFYFLIEEHDNIRTAQERSEKYFNAAFCAPYNDDLLHNEFNRVTPIGEGDYLQRRRVEHTKHKNEVGSVWVVEYEKSPAK